MIGYVLLVVLEPMVLLLVIMVLMQKVREVQTLEQSLKGWSSHSRLLELHPGRLQPLEPPAHVQSLNREPQLRAPCNTQ